MSLDSNIRRILPKRLFHVLESALGGSQGSGLESIRIRRDKPLSITLSGREWFVTYAGDLDSSPERSLRPSIDEVADILSLATQGSFYAVEDEIRRGYLTLPGGHRLGLSGEAVLEGGALKGLKHISSVQVRVAHEVKGCADLLMPHIVSKDHDGPHHTLLIGPPGSGKTTMLRDIARQLSDGAYPGARQPFQVAVADERSEIGGTYRGQVQLDVGSRTDVLDGAPKAIAIGMLIRSMAPDVIVTDEIGAPEDATAVADLIRCGVTLIASAHGSHIRELTSRPMLRELIESKAFRKAIFLSRRQGVGTIERVVDLETTSLPTRREPVGAGRWTP